MCRQNDSFVITDHWWLVTVNKFIVDAQLVVKISAAMIAISVNLWKDVTTSVVNNSSKFEPEVWWCNSFRLKKILRRHWFCSVR